MDELEALKNRVAVLEKYAASLLSQLAQMEATLMMEREAAAEQAPKDE